MKKLKALLISLLSLSVIGGMAACGQTPDNSSTPDTSISDTASDSTEKDITAGYTITTIAEALTIAQTATETTKDRYYLHGTITEVTDFTYGSMTIKDETGSIMVYGAYSADGEKRYGELTEKPAAGDEVLLYANLKNYNGTLEVYSGWIIDYISNQPEISDDDYTEMNITDARNAEKGSLIKTTGVVARITYAFGMKPNGFFLVDDTASIYVFSSEIATQVEIGNTVTLLGEKDFWILDSEQANAAKYGYNGCNQLTNAKLLSNEETNANFNTDWVEDTTVKAIMQTSVSTDITTKIFKVTALVKKVPGSGFTNYYIDDLDGATGSYCYTQCNGNDFAWLDEFDGEICTVYLTAINAKSTASGCIWRFVPIKVINEDYVFNTENAGKFAVEYYGTNQFESRYTADPALKLTTLVSSELLGFENATLSYTSSDTNIVTFTVEEDATVMHCVNYGTATITITGAYNGKTYETTITILFEKPTAYDAITVSEAIDAKLNSTVIVKGIVGPSLVNQVGFYLFGEDGSMIAVTTSGANMDTLTIGNEIILSGIRFRKVKDTSNEFGQTQIKDAEILVNNQGQYNYSTEKFITDKTLSDLSSMSAEEDFTTNVYLIQATISVNVTTYSTTVSLTSGSNSIMLYSGGKTDYEWLQAYKDQVVTVELALCNWNCKGYKGCVLAVRLPDGTKVLNTLNFN